MPPLHLGYFDITAVSRPDTVNLIPVGNALVLLTMCVYLILCFHNCFLFAPLLSISFMAIWWVASNKELSWGQKRITLLAEPWAILDVSNLLKLRNLHDKSTDSFQ